MSFLRLRDRGIDSAYRGETKGPSKTPAHPASARQGEFKVPQAYLAQRPDWLKHGPNVQYHSLQVAMYNEDAWAK